MHSESRPPSPDEEPLPKLRTNTLIKSIHIACARHSYRRIRITVITPMSVSAHRQSCASPAHGRATLGAVITHHGARIRMAGGDLDIPQVDPSIQHGRDERVPEHMWVRAGNSHSGGFSKPPQAACCGMPVHADAAAVEEDGSTGTAADGAVDGPSNSWRQRDQRDLGAFAAHTQHPVAVLFARVGDICA